MPPNWYQDWQHYIAREGFISAEAEFIHLSLTGKNKQDKKTIFNLQPDVIQIEVTAMQLFKRDWAYTHGRLLFTLDAQAISRIVNGLSILDTTEYRTTLIREIMTRQCELIRRRTFRLMHPLAAISEWVPRGLNIEADAMANYALDTDTDFIWIGDTRPRTTYTTNPGMSTTYTLLRMAHTEDLQDGAASTS